MVEIRVDTKSGLVKYIEAVKDAKKIVNRWLL